MIDLDISGSSLIITCSPLINVPVTCVNLTTELAPPAAVEYPVAPLLTPLTYDASGSSVLLTVSLRTIRVNVCISNKCKSHSVESPVYDASETAKE